MRGHLTARVDEEIARVARYSGAFALARAYPGMVRVGHLRVPSSAPRLRSKRSSQTPAPRTRRAVCERTAASRDGCTALRGGGRCRTAPRSWVRARAQGANAARRSCATASGSERSRRPTAGAPRPPAGRAHRRGCPCGRRRGSGTRRSGMSPRPAAPERPSPESAIQRRRQSPGRARPRHARRSGARAGPVQRLRLLQCGPPQDQIAIPHPKLCQEPLPPVNTLRSVRVPGATRSRQSARRPPQTTEPLA